jgi:hypothetical protein
MEAKILRALWQSAAILNDYRYHPAHWRKDSLGRIIYWFAYGDKKHPNGWDVGYIVAKADGGCEEISNLQVEHFETTAEKENVRRWFNNWRSYNPDLSVYGTGQRISPFVGNF